VGVKTTRENGRGGERGRVGSRKWDKKEAILTALKRLIKVILETKMYLELS
jgi:hypothetical protein